jgi:chromosome segregation ATPase
MSAAAIIPELLAEITRLQSDLDHATSHDGDGDHLSKASRRMVDTVMGDRDALRAEVERLRADIGETQLVLEQQDRDLERLRGEVAHLDAWEDVHITAQQNANARIAALETGLREAIGYIDPAYCDDGTATSTKERLTAVLEAKP